MEAIPKFTNILRQETGLIVFKEVGLDGFDGDMIKIRFCSLVVLMTFIKGINLTIIFFNFPVFKELQNPFMPTLVMEKSTYKDTGT